LQTQHRRAKLPIDKSARRDAESRPRRRSRHQHEYLIQAPLHGRRCEIRQRGNHLSGVGAMPRGITLASSEIPYATSTSCAICLTIAPSGWRTTGSVPSAEFSRTPSGPIKKADIPIPSWISSNNSGHSLSGCAPRLSRSSFINSRRQRVSRSANGTDAIPNTVPDRKTISRFHHSTNSNSRGASSGMTYCGRYVASGGGEPT